MYTLSGLEYLYNNRTIKLQSPRENEVNSNREALIDVKEYITLGARKTTNRSFLFER